ncbi:hypothetical protein [Methylobacterium oryzisoli]|uniref:hypothetical protein n=1 Tax=Methylobacterium oryzisoli TaxID=3385502 RepID=UPI00389191F3
MFDPRVQATQLRTSVSRLRRLAPNPDPAIFMANKDQLVADLETAAAELKPSGAIPVADGPLAQGTIRFGVVCWV